MAKRKEFNIYIILYMLICLGWAYIYKRNMTVESDSFINFLSMAIFALFANNIYILLNERSEASGLWHKCLQIPILISVATLVLTDTFTLVLCVLLLCFFANLFKAIKDRDKISVFTGFLLLLAGVFYYYELKPLVLLCIMAATFYSTYKKYGYKRLESLNFLPIARENVSKTLVVLFIFLALFIYILDLNTLAINTTIHLLMVISLIFISANLETVGRGYEEMKSFYVLAQYVEKERDEFSRLVHDEVIQDIKAGRNLLGLKEPDIERSKDILKNLEFKSRQIMNFYSSNLFDYFSFEENFENMLLSLQRLYPKKNTDVNWFIGEEISKKANKNIKQNIMQISKELINNIYKHSAANFINYSCQVKGEDIELYCESDGASREDYEKTKSSRGGILIVRALVSSNRGEIEYSYKDGLLRTEVKLGVVREDENTFI